MATIIHHHQSGAVQSQAMKDRFREMESKDRYRKSVRAIMNEMTILLILNDSVSVTV